MEPLTRGSFLEPLGEHSIGCVAYAGPARIGGRLRQILPDAWEPPEEGDVSVMRALEPGFAYCPRTCASITDSDRPGMAWRLHTRNLTKAKS